MQQSVLEHIKEFRNRVFYSVSAVFLLAIAAYVYYDFFYSLLSQPFESIGLKLQHQFYIKSVLEGVMIKLKFSLLFGLILAIPFLLFQALRFLFPGLKKGEKRLLIVSLLASFILSAISFVYSYFVLLPISLKFLMSHHFVPDNVGVLLTYSDNIFFAFNIMAYLAVLFQLPILLLLLIRFGVVSASTLLSYSRYFVVGIVILSAIITPPDVISQLLLSVPLLLLFFISILIAKLFMRKADV